MYIIKRIPNDQIQFYIVLLLQFGQIIKITIQINISFYKLSKFYKILNRSYFVTYITLNRFDKYSIKFI